MTKSQLISLLNEMTLDEKIGQLVQISGNFFLEENVQTGPISNLEMYENMIYKVGSILNTVGAKNVITVQNKYLEKSRLKIPLMFMADIINGYKTVFPIPLAQGCSWNTEVVKRCAQIAMKEASIAGVNVNLYPMVDLVRDARWGRVMESTGGEDTYLNEVYARVLVNAIQGDDISKEGNGVACIKHFAAYGAVESGREYNKVDMSERELRQYYMSPYKAGIEEKAKMIMTSFNIVDGIPATINNWLLREILRGEYGFDGVVISDYSAIQETIAHGVSKDKKDAALRAISAGVDIDMLTNVYSNFLKELVKEKVLDISLIDEAVFRVLKLKNELKLFENPYGNANIEKEKKILLSKENLEEARKLTSETFVLLKNEKHVLPINKNQKIALIGPYADNFAITGEWSMFSERENIVTIKQALEERIGKDNILYAKGSNMLTTREMNYILKADGRPLLKTGEELKTQKKYLDEAMVVAKNADIIVLAVGEHYKQSGEGNARVSIRLPKIQQKLINMLRTLNKPMVMVLFNGRPLVLEEIENKVDAILEVWFPGTEGARAIWDVLFGDENPSGKLNMCFPEHEGQCPIYYNQYNTGRPNIKNLRFESRYQDASIYPKYPFGFGLSYSKLKYKNLKLSSTILHVGKDDKIIVSVIVKNCGNVDAKEIVQLYIQDLFGSVVRPIKELKAFKKVLIKAKEETKIEFEITEKMLKFWNRDLEYTSEKGKFKVYVGCNSRDCLEDKFELI